MSMDMWQLERDNDAIAEENRRDTLYERKAVQAIERKMGYMVSSPLGDIDIPDTTDEDDAYIREHRCNPDGPSMLSSLRGHCFQLGKKR